MRRREFMAGTAATAAISFAGPACAQTRARVSPKVPLVAILIPGLKQFFGPKLAALHDGLKAEGLLEGSHYAVDIRFAEGDISRLPELARELDAQRPRVFVAAGEAAAAVHRLIPKMPLIFTALAVDPIASGFAQSYANPGGMATGNVMNAIGGENALTQKRLGLFRDLVPTINRLGMIGVAELPGVRRGLLSKQEDAALQTVSVQLGFGFENYAIQTLDDLEQVFSKALADGVDAFYISGDALLFNNISRVMPHIMAAGKPTFGVYPEWGRAGLLMSYSTDLLDRYYRAGIYAAKIIQGAKPGDLPIEQASKFTLVINRRTAKLLGISVPATLLSLADEVIE